LSSTTAVVEPQIVPRPPTTSSLVRTVASSSSSSAIPVELRPAATSAVASSQSMLNGPTFDLERGLEGVKAVRFVGLRLPLTRQVNAAGDSLSQRPAAADGLVTVEDVVRVFVGVWKLRLNSFF
jgi:hypothetical protein